ncbi:DUF3043 domain-containing protein [Pseudokineococcus basanitobsidens]|uniref:DUF3043 domain-containing protein n=1 Tax=Pseudokineococcus basanitobsidens TaxID=1926649 RepID=A0ABU8RJ79_9ACTN
MLGRRKTSQEPVVETAPRAAAAVDGSQPQGKGRPTPRRSEVEAARRRPLVVTDRKAAAKASRERLRAERTKTRTAMETGDERYLPPRDKGPQKRYVRDLVDARRNVGEYLLFAALVLVVLTFVLPPTLGLYVTLGLWFFVLAVVVDSFLLNRYLTKRLAARFGDDVPPGTARYGVFRALQIRRSRLPRPMVAHGQKIG